MHTSPISAYGDGLLSHALPRTSEVAAWRAMVAPAGDSRCDPVFSTQLQQSNLHLPLVSRSPSPRPFGHTTPPSPHSQHYRNQLPASTPPSQISGRLPATPLVAFEAVDVSSNGSFVIPGGPRPSTQALPPNLTAKHIEQPLSASFDDFIHDPSQTPLSPSSQVEAAKAALIRYREKAAATQKDREAIATAVAKHIVLTPPASAAGSSHTEVLTCPQTGELRHPFTRASPHHPMHGTFAADRQRETDAKEAHKARTALLLDSSVRLLVDIWDTPLHPSRGLKMEETSTRRVSKNPTMDLVNRDDESLEAPVALCADSEGRGRYPLTPASIGGESPISTRAAPLKAKQPLSQLQQLRRSVHAPTSLPTPPQSVSIPHHLTASKEPPSQVAKPAATSSPNSSIPLRTFVCEVLRRSRTGCSTLEAGMCYLEGVRNTVLTLRQRKEAVARMACPDQELDSPLLCPRRTFLASVLLASKFLQDKAYSNKAWAKLSGLPALEVGKCERALGDALGWRLWVGRGMEWPSAAPLPGEQVSVAALLSGSGRDKAVIESTPKVSAQHTPSNPKSPVTPAPNTDGRPASVEPIRRSGERSKHLARAAAQPYPKRTRPPTSKLPEPPAIIPPDPESGSQDPRSDDDSPGLSQCSTISSSSEKFAISPIAGVLSNLATAAMYNIPSAWSSLASLQSAADARSEMARWCNGRGQLPLHDPSWAFYSPGLPDITRAAPASRPETKNASGTDAHKATCAIPPPGGEWGSLPLEEILGNA